jgi:hypothetical protein
VLHAAALLPQGQLAHNKNVEARMAAANAAGAGMKARLPLQRRNVGAAADLSDTVDIAQHALVKLL